MTPLALGAFGRRVLREVAGHAAMFWIAGAVLWGAVELVERANAEPADLAGRLAALAPVVFIRLGKLALLLGGLSAGLRVSRTGERTAWLAAGGHPAAWLAGSLALGAVAAGAATLVGVTGSGRRTPPADRWFRDGPRLVGLFGGNPALDRFDRAVAVDWADGQVRARWDAETLAWVPGPTPEDGRWRASRLIERRFDDGGIRTRTSTGAPIDFGLRASPAVLRRLFAPTAAHPALRQRYGLTYRRAALMAHRRYAEPVAWMWAAALGLGTSLLLGARAAPRTGLLAGLGLAAAVFLADETAVASVDAAWVSPLLGALAPPALLVAATVTVWRRGVKHGIED